MPIMDGEDVIREEQQTFIKQRWVETCQALLRNFDGLLFMSRTEKLMIQTDIECILHKIGQIHTSDDFQDDRDYVVQWIAHYIRMWLIERDKEQSIRDVTVLV